MCQASALEAIHDMRGAFLPIRVGGGKTLISLLAPVILDTKRPLLLIPAALRDKTKRDARNYARDWRVARNLTLLSYEKLSVLSGLNVLDKIKPDLIVCDECHCVKNPSGPRWRRLKRYFREYPDTVFVAMSGSITNRSMDDYWHLLRWSLHDTAPIPHSLQTYVEWREALDAKVQMRRAPGVLVDLHPHAQGDDELSRARDAFARRLAESPGVVISHDKGPSMALTIRAITPPINREKIEPIVRRLRNEWCVPDGTPYETALEHWRHTGSLINCGLYHRWNPPAPIEWLTVRKAWSAFCRQVINQSQRGIDTPAQLMNTIDACRIDDGGLLAEWREIEPSFVPNSEAVWVDDFILEFAVKWLNSVKGLCWVEHREFSERLERVSGVPFFANYGKDKRGCPIEAHKGAAILSAQSNRIGRNLQVWHRNLVIYHQPNGRLWEQTLGRTHRDGQTADEVIYEIPIISLEQWRELCKARDDSRYIQEMTGQPQKLMYATWDVPDAEEVARRGHNDYLWREE